MSDPAKELFASGINLLGRGEKLRALTFFEKSYSLDPSNSICLSYLALLICLERGNVQKAIAMAKEAITQSPEIPVLHVNLARLYEKAGRNEDALGALRQSLKGGAIPEAKVLLSEINPRMKPLFTFLERSHFLNIWAGKILKKTGLRRFRMPEQKDSHVKLALRANKSWVKGARS